MCLDFLGVEYREIIMDSPKSYASNFNTIDAENTQADESSQMPSKKKQKGNMRSSVWDHFTKTSKDQYKCNYCGKNYACDPRKHGTRNLNAHIEKCQLYLKTLVDDKQKILYYQKSGNNESDSNATLVAVKSDKESCRQAIAEMIIMDELLFSFVDGRGFRHFLRRTVGAVDPPSRRTLCRDVFKIYLEEKEFLKIYLKLNAQRVSLTIDTWTSIQNINYMVITAHFIDKEWKLQKRILNFCPISNHKGETIGKLLEHCLQECGIERVFTITVDNASLNEVAINYLKKKVKNWRMDSLILNGDYMHIRCSAHILNLIVTEGFKDMNYSIAAIRNAVRYVRGSPARLKKFKACVESEMIEYTTNLVLDVPTRWNSTFMMLSSALKYQKALERMEDEDDHYLSYFGDEKNQGPLTHEDWENAAIFVRFLKVFYEVTLIFSASLNVTSHKQFHEMVRIFSHLDSVSNEDTPLGRMGSNMLRKFNKYWGSLEDINMLLLVAVFLDPRFKLEYIAFIYKDLVKVDVDKHEMIISKLKNFMYSLYETYNALGNSSHVSVSGSSSQSSTPRSGLGGLSERGKFSSVYSDDPQHPCNKWGLRESDLDSFDEKNVVDRYLFEPIEKKSLSIDFNILLWWRLNKERFPILSKIARDVLAILVSTVASESAFSTGGRLLDPFRSSLTPKTVEALVCTQNWLPHKLSIELVVKEDCNEDNIELCESVESEMVGSTVTALEVMEL